MKKYFMTVATVALFAIGFAASDEESKESQQTEQKQETEAPQKQKESFLGTYEITDKVGCTIRITLNKDETATITGTSSNGENITYYCTWSDFTNMYGGIRVWYGDTDQTPYLVFDGGDNVKENYVNPGGCLTPDGWYYVTMDRAKAKNPKWRLKATKIK